MDLALPPDFKEFLRLLKKNDVRFLLIGEYLDGVEVSLIDLEHLKKNKKASGRAKNLADLERLP